MVYELSLNKEVILLGGEKTLRAVISNDVWSSFLNVVMDT